MWSHSGIVGRTLKRISSTQRPRLFRNYPGSDSCYTKSFFLSSRHLSSSSSSSALDPSCHVLIVGGGPVGCSTAYHLALSDSTKRIVVVEQDATYATASAMLSAGGIRQQFSLTENVQMSLYGIDFLRTAHQRFATSNHDNKDPNPVQLEEHGYLFLASSHAGRDQLMRNHETQQAAGATDICLVSPEDLAQQFPWLYTDDLVLGSLGKRGEGWFDPWSYLQGLKRACQAMGVVFVQGRPIGTTRRPAADASANVSQPQQVVEQVHIQETTTTTTTLSPRVSTYTVDQVVNATGAHCRSVLNVLAGGPASSLPRDQVLAFPLPVYPRKRCIFAFHCPTATDWTAPLTVCPTTGVYFRSTQGGTATSSSTTTKKSGSESSQPPQGGSGYFLAGVSPPAELDTVEESVWTGHGPHELTVTAQDYETLFEDLIWPALYERVPDHFGELKVQSSWAGFYECTYQTNRFCSKNTMF